MATWAHGGKPKLKEPKVSHQLKLQGEYHIMRLYKGYFMSHREIYQTYFEGNYYLGQWFDYICKNAHHQDFGDVYYQKIGKKYKLKPGEFYTTWTQLETWTGVNRKTLKKWTEYLVNMDLLRLTSHKSCICLSVRVVNLPSSSADMFLKSGQLREKEIKREIETREKRDITIEVGGGNSSSEDSKESEQELNSKSSQDKPTAHTETVSGNSSSSEGASEKEDETKTQDMPRSRKKDPPKSVNPKSRQRYHHALFDIWNEHRGILPKAAGMNSQRQRMAKARFDENNDPEYWKEVVTRLSKSNFACGDNDRAWKAGFDFLIRPETHLKVMEGKFDNKKRFKPEKDYGSVDDLLHII